MLVVSGSVQKSRPARPRIVCEGPQGLPVFDARSVCLVREHGKMATCLGEAATAKAGNGAGDFFQHSLSRLFQFYGKNRQVIVYGISLSPLVDGFHDGIDTVFHRILAGGFND